MFEINLVLSLESVGLSVFCFLPHLRVFSVLPPSRDRIFAHGFKIISEVSVIRTLGFTLAGQVLNDFPNRFGILEDVQQDIIGYLIGYSMHASVEACL